MDKSPKRNTARVIAFALALAMLIVMGSCGVMFLNGCATSTTTGVTQETIAKAEIGVGAAYKTLNELFVLGKVSKPDAVSYRARLVNAEDLLRQAEASARSSDPATANTAQAAAVAIITEITQALAARKAAK